MNINLKFEAKFNHLIFLIFTLLTSYSFAQKCGCGATGANLCSPQYYTTKAAAEADASTGTPAATIDLSALNLRTDAGQTHQLCYEYTTKSTETKIGFRFYVGTPQNCSENRVISISPTCGGTSLTPTSTTSAGFNEYNVTPSTKYNICVTLTFDVADTDCDEVDPAKPAEIQYVELYVYNAEASSSCNASIGTAALTNLAGTGNELSVNPGDTWTIKHNNFTLPPAGNGGSFMGYLVYTCKPPAVIDITDPSIGVATGCFKGTSKTATDLNLSGSSSAFSGISELWIVPVTFDTDVSLADGKDRIDEDLDGCYDIGQAIHITYLSSTNPTCTTCETATCKVTSITATTLAKGRTDITTALASAGDQYGGLLLIPDESATLCVPVKVPQGSTALGFKMKTTLAPGACGSPLDQIITYELKPVGCGTKINPTRTNAQPVSSGFNPEWDNIAPGDYILCFTMNTDPYMLCATVEINGLGYYNVGNVCPADNGTQAVKINNSTPPATKVYATNSYGLCYNDIFSITTTNANPSVDYAIYIGAPTSNNPSTEPTKFTADFKLNLNQLSETSTGNTSPVLQYLNTTSFKPVNNTIWWVPISTSTVGMYDPACYNMDYQNESYKVTYLNDIKITPTEVCSSSKVTLKFEGGAPEFITGKKYNVTTNKGSLSAATVTSSGGTIDLTGLVQNDNYTISVTDEIGCVKTYTGTYTCSCTQPTLTGPSALCDLTTVEYTSNGVLTSSDVSFAGVVASGTTNKFNVSAYKPTTASTNLKLTSTLNGCSTTKDITINPKPTITGNLSLCAGATSQLTGSGTAASTNAWLSATTSNATISNTGLVSGASAGNGNSVITYTDNNGCTNTTTVSINPNTTPTVTCGTSTATSVTFTWGAVTGATTYDIVYNKDNGGDQSVTGHTTTTYPVSNVPAGKSVTIIVTPKGTGCFKASSIQTCIADNCPTPSITQEPANVSKCAGESTSFVVAASSTATLSYQWQINNGANPATNITDGGVYSGATTPSLSISNVTGLTGTKYQCLVTETSSGTGCNKTSIAAILTVNPIPSFVPTVSDICEGNDPALAYTNLIGNPNQIVFDPNLPSVSPINIPVSSSPIVITGLPIKLPVNTYSGLKVRLENTVTGCKSSDFTIASFKVQATQKPSISSKGTDVSSVTFQWSDLTGLNTQTGANEDNYLVEEFICNSCSTVGAYGTATGTLTYNTSTSKWEYLKNNLQPGDKVFIKVTPKDNTPLATPSCYGSSEFDLTAIPCDAPIITKDLVDVTLCEGTAANPVSTLFDLEYNTADVTTPATWEFLTPGGTWTTLNQAGVYSVSGTTNSSSTLSISDVKGLDGFKFRVILKTATVGGTCNTVSKEVLLTVKPLPTMVSVADKSFCPGTLVNDPLKPKDFDFKVSQAGSPTFTWKSDVQTTGVKLEGINSADGSKNVSEFEPFTTSSPSNDVVSIVTVIPTLNQCVGQPITFKIMVKPTIKPINFASVNDFNNVKFTWATSSVLPDYWNIDTAITNISAAQPTLAQYKNVTSPLVTGATTEFTVGGINSNKKAYIIVTPKQDPSKTDLFCPASDGFNGIPTPCTKPIKPADPIVTPVCEGAPITVNGVNNDLTANFQWKISTDAGITWNNVSFADFANTGTTNILSSQLTKSYMNNALVKVVLTDKQTGQCTEESKSVKLLINELPTVNLIQPLKTSLCIDDNDVSAFVQPVQGKSPLKIDYTLNGVASINQDITNLEIKFSAKIEMNYSLSITKVVDANNCESNLTGLTSLVSVHKNPVPNFAVSDTIGCYPLKINFTDISGEKFTDVTWDFGTGTNSSKDIGTAAFTYQKQGDYTITYSVINEYGCSGEIVKVDKIHVKNSPKAVISTDRNIVNIYENVVQFNSKLSQNGTFYKWDFGDNSSFSNEPIVKHKYDPTLTGKFKVYLIVSNSTTNASCSDTAITWIDFPEEVVYFIPNTFTPNGDEFNNTFQPIFTSGFDPQNYLFTIFDRWGQIVFESKNPHVGWDGTYGDKLLGNDTYVWKLGFKEKANDNEHHTTGHVNLVK
jgi:gliding motility-associated-like protein